MSVKEKIGNLRKELHQHNYNYMFLIILRFQILSLMKN